MDNKTLRKLQLTELDMLVMIDKICRDNNIGDYSLNYDLIEDKDAFIKSVIIADSTCDTTYLKEFINHIVVSKNVKHK